MNPSDFSIEQDRALLSFIIDNAASYDRYEIFLQAQKESLLSQKTILDLYLRYHRFLFPLFTGKPSDESVQLESIRCVDNNGSKHSSTKHCFSGSKTSDNNLNGSNRRILVCQAKEHDLESETSDYGSANSSRTSSNNDSLMDSMLSNTMAFAEAM
uniref:RGS domain-containing protein n=1 Tax=Caenorhabditis tropicalis TaxID=1561998 RepID=A0A1I7UE31_9PELO